MLTYGKEQIEWRRNRVLELSSQGHNQHEIAQTLQIAKGTVNSDLAYLRKRAQENLQHHIHETVPAEYQKCCTQINQVLKKAWEIVDNTADERVRLQALALIDQCNTHKMDMVTNGTIITDALDYVNGKAEKLVNTESVQTGEQEVSELVPKQSEEEEAKTTSDVF
jgi:transcriptional regulator